MSDSSMPPDLTEGHATIIRLLARQAAESYLQHQAEQRPLRFLRTRDVCDKIACSNSQLYNIMAEDPSFPRPFKDGDSRQSPNYWVGHEVEEWMCKRMERANRT